METDKTVQRHHRVVIAFVFVVGVGAHDFGVGRPAGIGIFQLHFFKGFRRFLITRFVQIVMRPVIKLLGRHIVEVDIVGSAAEQQRGSKQQRQQLAFFHVFTPIRNLTDR